MYIYIYISRPAGAQTSRRRPCLPRRRARRRRRCRRCRGPPHGFIFIGNFSPNVRKHWGSAGKSKSILEMSGKSREVNRIEEKNRRKMKPRASQGSVTARSHALASLSLQKRPIVQHSITYYITCSYVYIYIHTYISLSLSIYIYRYIHIHTYIYMYSLLLLLLLIIIIIVVRIVTIIQILTT